MSRWTTVAMWGAVGAACIGTALLWAGRGAAQQRKDVAVESLLPREAVLYFGWDGTGAHAAEWQATAAYKSLYETGLVDVVKKAIATGLEQAGQSPADEKFFAVLQSLSGTVCEKGVSFALAIETGDGPPLPQAVLVLHGSAQHAEELAEFIESQSDIEFEARDVEGRTVFATPIPDTPDYELGWWVEGNHLVFAAGKDAISATIATAEGAAPNITANPLWKQYRAGEADFTVSTVGWLDFAKLRETFGGMPLPDGPRGRRLTINDVLKPLGLDGLQTIGSRSGYKGEALWSETVVETQGERRGLLAYLDQKPISLDDLPPLPAQTGGFYASSFDWTAAYENTLNIVRDFAKIGPPEAQAGVEQLIQSLPLIVQFDPKEELFDPLGDVICIYGEPSGGLFGLGFGIAIKVDDAETLRGTLEHIGSMVTTQTEPEQLTIRETEKHGRSLVTLSIGNGFFNPTYVVDEEWWVIGLTPQTPESFLLRQDGKLPTWEPTGEWKEALEAVPQEFVSISTADPRGTVTGLLSLAPIVVPAIQQAMRQNGAGELPISVADLPPAELVAAPLFPNVTVATVDENGVRWTTRASLPALPFVGGGSQMSSVTTSATLVALLLPAVQSAREAARRTQSKDNLHNIIIALHNYHEIYGRLPYGAHPSEELAADKRLSWIADLLPFIEEGPLHQQIDFDAAWDSEENAVALRTRLRTFENPSVPVDEDAEYGATHYVGMAGVGEDAPTLKQHTNKTGAFGYDRALRFADVTDGLSNTIGVVEAAGDPGPWGAAGSHTIRALTQQPYINGPDGLGGAHAGGMNAVLLDGVVRFVSEDIDPSVLEALSTVRGGEFVGDF